MGEKTFRFHDLQKWKDFKKKKQLTLHKVIYCKRFTENRLEYNP